MHSYPHGASNYAIHVTLVDEDGTWASAGAKAVMVTETLPVVASPTSSTIGSLTARLGGTVLSTGSVPLVKRGIVYSVTATNASPTIGGSGVVEVDDALASAGAFANPIAGLTPGTAYTFAAFATNGGGTAYSPVSSFTSTNGQASGLNGAANAVAGQAMSYSLLSADAIPGMQSYYFLFKITWGDGKTDAVTAHSGDSFAHTYTSPGTYVAVVTATDGRGNMLATGSITTTVLAHAALEGTSLYVTGTAGNDAIVLSNAIPGSVTVILNGSSLGSFAPSTAIIVVGGGGTDTLVAPDSIFQNNWTLSGSKTGSLSNPGFPAPVSFSGITNLTGGAGDDSFAVQTLAGGFNAVAGAGGVNTLDYSAVVSNVAVNLVSHTASGISSATGFTVVIGGRGNDTLTADARRRRDPRGRRGQRYLGGRRWR